MILAVVSGQEADSVEPALHTGWSVVVNGRGEVVMDPTEVQRLAELVHPWSRGERSNVVRIHIEQLTGRLYAGGVTVLHLDGLRSQPKDDSL